MLVIYAEKGSLAKTIAAVLHAGQRIPLKGEPTVGYYQFQYHGEDAVLCHGIGHLMQLAPAKSYDAKFAKWDLSVFPCIPQQFKLAAKAETVACARLVRSFLKQADWVINATDPDREGELIFSYVYQACGCHAPVMRVWIEDLTDAKIQKAFSNLIAPDQPISPQNPGTPNDLQAAGRVRDIADWLIGNNLTVAATKKFGGYEELLSVGRVQTPTLALVVEREKAIRSFVKAPFWRLIADFTTPAGEHFEAEYSGGKFDRQEDAQRLLTQCGNHPGIVRELETKRRTQVAPLLYNATQLQIAANKKFGWNADKTSKIMQNLYEKKLMTYPRTSSEHLTAAMIPETAQTIAKLLQMPEYTALSLPKNQWQKFTKRHFDDSKVGSHPAIIPTVNVPQNLNGLSSDEKALYDLLAKSLIRIIYPKAVLDDTTVLIDVNQVEFNPTFQQKELRTLMTETDTKPEAWYPLGQGDKTLLSQPIIVKLAEKYGVGAAQIPVAWAIAKGTLPIIGVTKESQVLDAVKAANISITAEDAAELEKLADSLELNVIRVWEKEMK